jgi:lactate dehydrogenase-like 2-hydroxyacid dehydrogenase
MKFKQITIIDTCGLTPEGINSIRNFSENKLIIYDDVPQNEEEILLRIGSSDCILVSWRTRISKEIIAKQSSLKYIGMCCSLYAESASNVNISAAKAKGISVKGVRDYGDEGVVEFIFAQLINLFKGYSKYQWRTEATELTNKSIGIIGLGTLGLMVAKMAHHFGMKVYYFSKTRKIEFENEHLQYLSLDELLTTCDVITTHLPKNSIILNSDTFLKKKENSILINTSLGLTFDKDAFINWLVNNKTSYAIFDSDGAGSFYDEFTAMKNVITYPKSSGFTIEARQRLSAKVSENIVTYFEE